MGSNRVICESLQSEVNNFVSAFFGAVTKVDVSPGVVDWQLPCGLDLGLPSNPRGFGEGISCYFLRLLHQSIVDFAGPAGNVGQPGTNGQQGFSVTLSAFNQPVNSSTIVTVRYFLTSAIQTAEFVFVQGSGWYSVLDATNGVLSLSLVRAIGNPKSIIDAGRIVIPVAPGGLSIKGAPGVPGDKGDKGGKGPTGQRGPTLLNGPTQQNGIFEGGPNSNFSTGLNGAVPVVFGTVPAQVILPVAGQYLVRFTSTVTNQSSAVNSPLNLSLQDTTDTSVNTQALTTLTEPAFEGGVGFNQSVTVNAVGIVTTLSPNNVLQLFANGLFWQVRSTYTRISWVRIT